VEDPENLGSGMAGAGDSLVKQYPPAIHQFLEVPLNTLKIKNVVLIECLFYGLIPVSA
jgi:hypothetical protein